MPSSKDRGAHRFLLTELFSLLLLLPILTSCVGTVQDTSQAYSNVSTNEDVPLKFSGVTFANAISDTRIEVFFYPAVGGSGKYTYDVMVGNSTFPLSFPSDVLSPDYRGLLKVTLSGLSRLTSYQVQVEVRDANSTVQSKSGTVKSATTFDNMVADFEGISTVSNLAGQDGKDSVRIRWTPARTSGSVVKQTWDPVSYEVIVVDAEKLTPGDMDGNYTQAQGKWTFSFNHDDTVNEFVARGLLPKKRYYVRMRCLHVGSVDNVFNPKLRGEMNTKYLTVSTLSDSLSDLTFEPQSFSVALAPGEEGLSAIITSWSATAGVFDHFRIYYSLENGGVANGALPALCLSKALSAPTETVFCKKVDVNATSTPVTGLLPYTNYELVLVLCQTVDCLSTERIVAPTRFIATNPALPTFNGLKSILPASYLEDLGSMFLTFDPPNFTTGYFDGLIIKMRRTSDGSDPEVLVDTTTTTGVYNLPYSFLTESQIRVQGIDYMATDPYCFTLYPYKYDTDGVTKIELPNGVWKCSLPQIAAPTAAQFPGIAVATTTQSTVTLTWARPTQGIFSKFEIFYRKQSTVFSWGDAIAQAAGASPDFTLYERKVIDSSLSSVTIDNLADGDYAFGVVTYFNYVTSGGAVELRSETNGNIYKCTVNSANAGNVSCSL